MNIQQLPSDYIEKIVEIALAEDVGRGDVTSDSLIPELPSGQSLYADQGERDYCRDKSGRAGFSPG